MRQWTLNDVQNFDKWLRGRGGRVNYPVSETNNGQFVIPMDAPKGKTAQQWVDTYDRTVVNA